MKVSLLHIILFFLTLSGLRAQDGLVLIKSMHGDIADFTTDNLGNIYMLSSSNQLKKYNQNGDSISVYNNLKKYGKIYSMDATNPFRLLLYYKDFSVIVELDRLLVVRNIIDLKKRHIFQPSAVAMANDNNIWVYDDQEAKLKKIGQDGSLLDLSTDLRQIVKSVPTPTIITDQNGLVYLYDAENGLYIFDYFGTLQKQLAFIHWHDFQVVDKYLFGRRDSTLLRYASGSLNLQEQPNAVLSPGIKKMRISLQHLYLLKGGTLQIYKLP